MDVAVLGAYCELYQVSTGPRAWTDEIDGSSSFTVLTGVRLRAQDIDFEEDSVENPRVYAQDSGVCRRTDLTDKLDNRISERVAGETMAGYDIACCSTRRIPSPQVSCLFLRVSQGMVGQPRGNQQSASKHVRKQP